jgi:hypothetical protein
VVVVSPVEEEVRDALAPVVAAVGTLDWPQAEQAIAAMVAMTSSRDRILFLPERRLDFVCYG